MKTVNDMTVKEMQEATRKLAIEGRSKAKLKTDLQELLAVNDVAGINEETGEILFVSRQVKRANEREMVKTLGQAIAAMNKFNPELADAVLAEVKEGAAINQALKLVQDKNGKLVSIVGSFMDAFYIPKKMKMPKKNQVHVYQADLVNAEVEANKIVASENYDDLSDLGEKSGVMRTSTSDLVEKLGVENVWVTVKRPFTQPNGQVVLVESDEPININVAKSLMVVTFGELNDVTEETILNAMDNGIYIRENGKLVHYVYLLRSNSQARQLKGMFMRNDGTYSIPGFLRKLGHEPIVYAKHKDGVYSLDMTKPDKRKGLSGTNTYKVFSFRFGKHVKYVKPGTVVELTLADVEAGAAHELVITGGPFTIRVTEDRYAYVKEGMFKAIDKEGKKIAKLDASEENQKFVVGDGQCFFNKRVAETIGFEFGQFGAAMQDRKFNHAKGMTIAVDGLDAYYPEDFVLFSGSVKGNLVETIRCGHPMEIRMARLNPTAKTNKMFTLFPYQFMQTISISAEQMWDVVKPHLDKVKAMLSDYSLMEQYLGLVDLDSKVEGMEEVDADDYLDTKLTTLLARAMYYSDGAAYGDAYLKRSAFKLIGMMIRKWMTGQIPVQGHYKYLIQDPIAILDAAKLDVRDAEGDLLVPEHVGLRPNTAIISVWDEVKGHEVCHEGEVSLHRNPAITQGEAAFVTAVYDKRYAVGMKKGFYSNMAILSCHDFALVQQGGADVDGDTSFVCFEATIVANVKNAKHIPVLDRYFVEKDGKKVFKDGCPFPGADNKQGIPTIDPRKVVKQDGFELKFTREQYTDELVEHIQRVEKAWVMRTLQANKIGYLTNAATIMADTKRRMVYALRLGKDINGYPLTEAKRDEYLFLVDDYQEKIDWLRYAQGWEIDRAKHGGAYEEQLAEQLAFATDRTQLPELCSYVSNKETGIRSWSKPVWFTAFNKCETPQEIVAHYDKWLAAREGNQYQVQSVLGKHLTNMITWFNGFKADFDAMEKDVAGNHNLISFISPLRPSNDAIRDLIAKLAPIANYYNTTQKSIVEEYNAAIKEFRMEFVQGLISDDYLAIKLEQANETRKQLISFLVEDAKKRLAQADVDHYAPEHIGFVAYMGTYSEVKKGKKATGLSFPWQIADEYLMVTLEKAAAIKAGTVTSDVEAVTESVNVTIRAFVPEELEAKGITKESVAKMISVTSHHGVIAKRVTDKNGNVIHALFAVNPATNKYEAVGKFFGSVVEEHFGPHATIKMMISAVRATGKHGLQIDVTTMTKN